MRVNRVITIGVAVIAVLTACSSKPKVNASPPTPTETPTPTPTATGHPFNGGDGDVSKPVLAVKFDNTRSAKPQLGLTSADIVYVEQVEGGLTRIMAIYSSKVPGEIGPVRSARISDLHILNQYDRPALAFSGVQTKMLPVIAKAPLYDVSNARGGYFRKPGRSAPYNLFARTNKLFAAAPKAGKPKDIGWTFGEAPAQGGAAKTSYPVKYPAASFQFKWSAEEKKWLVWQDGSADKAAEGGQLGAPTIVIQYAKTTRSEFHDVNRNYTPLIHTTGTGKAVVLRDGQAFDVTWSRSAEKDGTKFTMADGSPMPFAPGQVWVVLANSGKPVIP